MRLSKSTAVCQRSWLQPLTMGSVRWMLVLSLAFMSLSANAQIQWGVSSGINQSQVVKGILTSPSPQQADTALFPNALGELKRAASGGIFLRGRLSRNVSYLGELQFSRKGLYNPYEELNANLDYISLPQTLQFGTNRALSIGVGAEASWLLNYENWGALVPSDEVDWAALGSVFYQTPIQGLMLSARYSRGLSGFVNVGFSPQSGVTASRDYDNAVLQLSVLWDPLAKARSYKNKPPILKIEDWAFSDAGGNNVINAEEAASVDFVLKNDGFGSADGVVAYVTMSGSTEGISCPKKIKIGSIKPDKTTRVSVPLRADRETVDGQIELAIDVVEPDGFNPSSGPLKLSIQTQKFDAPNIEVVDFDAPEVWLRNSKIKLTLLVQNTGSGAAERIEMSLNSPQAVFQDPRESVRVKRMIPGETRQLEFDFMIPTRDYKKDELELELVLEEKHGKYASNWVQSFVLEQLLESGDAMVVEGQKEDNSVTTSSLSKDIIFNQFDRQDTIQRIFVCANDGENCFGEPSDGQDIASSVESLLLGEYDILERRYFEQILDEQKLAISGLVLEETAVELGCNAGSQGILFVEEGCLDGERTVILKLVGCQSSEVYWTCMGIGASAFETIARVKFELAKTQ